MSSRVWIPSPNYSSRGGSGVRLIVVHTTEGAQDIYSLGSFFGSSSAGVSSHVGTDNNSRTVIGEYVKRGNKAWTQGNANPVAVSCEMCTPSGAAAGWSRSYWLNSKAVMLDATALWVAEEADYYGIPITALTPSQAQGGGRGVCQHADLGSWGGGHVDCGAGFPMDYLISKAKEFAGGAPVTPPEKEEEDMSVCIPAGANGDAVAVSFNGPQYKTVGFLVDASVLSESVHIRTAFHRVSGGWDVIQVYVDPGHNKVVINIPNPSDGVSFSRIDDMPVDVYPNFA